MGACSESIRTADFALLLSRASPVLIELVEAARFELASLTVEVRSLYMLSPFFNFPFKLERDTILNGEPLSLLSFAPKANAYDQSAVDARLHPADLDGLTVAVLRRLAVTPCDLRRAHARYLGSCF